jgi:hypothetical protein
MIWLLIGIPVGLIAIVVVALEVGWRKTMPRPPNDGPP